MRRLENILSCLLTSSAVVFTVTCRGQAPEFTNVRATGDGLIQLNWTSTTNGIYQIEFRSLLSDEDEWRCLYTSYPSHGTNTSWVDAGNNRLDPEVNRPESDTARYYRVVQIATNSPVAPQLELPSLINGTNLIGKADIFVTISSTNPVTGLRLMLDGIEVEENNGDETSFSLNTPEWANGQHTVFVIADGFSGFESTDNDNNLELSYGLTPHINVTFSNYVSEFHRTYLNESQELQTFSALFMSYSAWTLNITNVAGAHVRTESGLGYDMSFTWDGTDDDGVDVPAGIYQATVTALAGPPPEAVTGSNSEQFFDLLALDPPPPATSLEEALLLGQRSYFVEQPPLPPELEELLGHLPLLEIKVPEEYVNAGGTTQLGTSVLADSLTALEESNEPPILTVVPPGGSATINTVKGIVGTVGVAYQGHHPSGKDLGIQYPGPSNGSNETVTLDQEFILYRPYGKLINASKIANGFSKSMKSRGWKTTVNLGDDKLTGAALRSTSSGGNNVFNTVNFGLLVGHGIRGLTPDYTTFTSGPKTTYYPVWKSGTSSYDYVGLSDMDLGSANLHWMGILSCNNMFDANYQDMWLKNALPINNALHLLLGSKTGVFMVGSFGKIFGEALTGELTGTEMSVADAWFRAGQDTQLHGKPNIEVWFRVSGWPTNFADTISNPLPPDSGDPADITVQDAKVFPSQ